MKVTYALLLNLLVIQYAFSQLNGTYTIGITPSDYQSITLAVNDITVNGMSGPVIFNIKDGIYQEQNIEIGEITGLSGINSITFQSESLNAENTTINGSRIFKIESGAKHLLFNHLTFDTQTSNGYPTNAFKIQGTAISDITISNCKFDHGGSFSSEGSENYSFITVKDGVTNLNILNNQFLNNGAVIYAASTSNNDYPNNITIENNEFNGELVTPFYMFKVNDLTISNNKYNGLVKYRSMWLAQLSGTTTISGNKIITDNTDFSFNNSTFIGASTTGNTGGNLIFKNNFLSQFSALSISYFNNILISNNSFSSKKHECLRINEENNLQSLEIYNNIFSIDEDYPSIEFNNSLNLNILSSNNNAFSKEKNAISIYQYNNTNNTGGYYDFIDWINFSGKDQNSKIVNNVYFSDTDLHTPNAFLLNGTGISVPNITHDIDGEIRNVSNPDIGADEFDMDYSNYRDLEIVEIVSPTINCGNSNVVLSLKNNGNTIINSFDIECAINDFRGNISSYNSPINANETIQIPVENCQLIGNTYYDKIEFFVSNPNNLLDNNYSNDYKSVTNVLKLSEVTIINEEGECTGDIELIVPLIHGTTVLWSTGETLNRIIVSQPGTYSVTITDLYGCQVTNAITLN